MSDKFQVIDHATFEKMQQSTSSVRASSAVQKIRNSKYKRMNATYNFNLLQFVKDKQKGKILPKKGKRVPDSRIVPDKKKGKQREEGIIKKPSRLKKSILQYRQKKREQAQLENKLGTTIVGLNNLVVDNDKQNEQRMEPAIHSNSFREYCNCCKTPDLRKYCEQLIRELNHFQRRAYAQNEIKARAHKRFVVGFRQVQMYLRINKIKFVIIATDCECHEGEVSLNETIENIKTICNDQQIPIAFPFKRREMAYYIYQKASISCIGIIDYDGAREIFAHAKEALKNARDMYNSLFLIN